MRSKTFKKYFYRFKVTFYVLKSTNTTLPIGKITTLKMLNVSYLPLLIPNFQDTTFAKTNHKIYYSYSAISASLFI